MKGSTMLDLSWLIGLPLKLLVSCESAYMRNAYFKIFATFVLVALTQSTQAGDYYKKDRLLFDFYSPMWINGPSDMSTDPTFSFAISYGKDVSFKRDSKFSCFYALGYDFNNINHNLNLKSIQNLEFTPRELGARILNAPFSLNRLSSHYLELPLELRYRTQTKNPFRIYAGAKGGYLIKSKYELDQGSGDIYERKSLEELERFKYGLTFRIGYGLINLYAYYGLNGLMKPEDQKGVNQLSFGITLMAN